MPVLPGDAARPRRLMEIFAWWLIVLPVAFSLGWLAARVDMRHVVSETRRLPVNYLQGIGHLLHDEREKAIEAFLEAAKADPDTVELNFALGSLFRQQGETERAIRMHRSILEREGLPDAQRDEALDELALDYRKAGFLDLAEQCLRRLAARSPAVDVSGRLFSIYRQQRDWENAIRVARAAESPDPRTVAHLHCEWAEDIGIGEARREELLAEASRADPGCGRALALRGALAAERGDDDAAIGHWRALERCQPEALEVVVAPLMDAHVRAGRASEGERLLRGYLRSRPTAGMFEAVFDALAGHLGFKAVADLPEAHLGRLGGPIAALKWLEVKRRHADPAEREGYERLHLAMVRDDDGIRHVCRECGFGSVRFHWGCPACQGWETFLRPGQDA